MKVFTLLYLYGDKEPGFYEIKVARHAAPSYLMRRFMAAVAAKYNPDYAGQKDTMFLGVFELDRKPNTSELGERLDQMINEAVEREPHLKDAVNTYLRPERR